MRIADRLGHVVSHLIAAAMLAGAMLAMALPARAQQADVVFVVDTSGSMDDEVAAFQNGLNAFASTVQLSGVDLHVVLIAASSVCAVQPLGSGMCGGADSNLPAYRHLNQAVGSTNALATLLATYDGWSPSLRPNSARSIVVLTDDDSDLAASEFNRSLLALDSGFTGYRLHGIVADFEPIFTDPCYGIAADRGDQYLDLIMQTGGVHNNLCDQNVAVGMYDIAAGVIEQAESLVPRFSDVPFDFWAYDFIESLADAGITSGCGNGNYCPDNPVTRAQMAVFLERSMRGSGYVPPTATGSVFGDVGMGSFAAAFIEQLFDDGITSGCGMGNYCPSSTVTRAQMAVFLLRAEHGSDYTPPAATGVFGDVGQGYWASAWIEQLADEGITSGCGGGNFCPDNAVTRAQMAVFLVRAFDFDAPPVGEFDCPDVDANGVCDAISCDAAIVLDDSDPLNAARALGLCATTTSGQGYGVIDAAWVRANGAAGAHSNQVGIMDGFGANVFSQEGSRLLALSSGRARTPGQPGACNDESCMGVGAGVAPPFFPNTGPGCPAGSGINDDVALELTLRAPTNAQGFAFNSSFYTFEYPEWVCTEYNDQFIALLDPPLTGDGNVVFDAQGRPVSVNVGFFGVCVPSGANSCPSGTAELVGTGFDTWDAGGIAGAGATGWLTTTVPVTGGQEFTLRFVIWDTGDQYYDSTAILDNFRWLVDPSSLGTTQ